MQNADSKKFDLLNATKTPPRSTLNEDGLKSPKQGDIWGEVMAARVFRFIRKMKGRRWLIFNYKTERYEIVSRNQVEATLRRPNGNWSYDLIIRGSNANPEKVADITDCTIFSRYIEFRYSNLIVVSDYHALNAFYATKDIAIPRNIHLTGIGPWVLAVGSNNVTPIEDFFSVKMVKEIHYRLDSNICNRDISSALFY